MPRTYCSKVETQRATPTLKTLEKLARGLGVSVGELLSGREQGREDEIRSLISEPFIRELAPFVSRLDGLQMRSILAQVGQMTRRTRRVA